MHVVVCQCLNTYLIFSKKPIVGIGTPILGMRRLRHRDVKCLPKVPYFVAPEPGLESKAYFWIPSHIDSWRHWADWAWIWDMEYLCGASRMSWDIFFSLLFFFHWHTNILWYNPLKIRHFKYELFLKSPSLWISSWTHISHASELQVFIAWSENTALAIHGLLQITCSAPLRAGCVS